jgi:hypothetical protein
MTQRKPRLFAFLSLLFTFVAAPVFAVTATEAPGRSAPAPIVLNPVIPQTGLGNGGAIKSIQTVPGLDVPALESVGPTAAVETRAARLLPAPAPGLTPTTPVSFDPAASGAIEADPGAAPEAPAPVSASQLLSAAQPLRDADVRGKTLLMVGTRGSRPFIIEEAVRVAKELGLNLVLLDKAENRKNSAGVVADLDFVAAPIDHRDDKTMKSITEQVQALAKTRKIDYVVAFRSHHAKLVGKIVDATGISGVPGRVALTAEDKAKTRKALNAVPEQAVPYREVKTEAEVREFYRQYGGTGSFSKFVMKSKLGENSRFVELDIDSEEKLVSAFLKMDAALRAEAKKKEASDTIFNRYPGIIVERMLEKAPGTVEASVEMVVQNGAVKFAMVSDTHGVGLKGELAGGSMTFPSQMTQQVQDALVAASVKALAIVGLRDGNARVDIMMTPDGPKVIEINPFLGGAAIYTAIKLVTGISLVEWGIRALLGLSLPKMPAFTTIVDYRFAASQVSGEVVAIDGVDKAKAVPGVKHVQVLVGPGDTVAAPIENGFEEWAEVMGTGATFAQAQKASVEALSKIKAKVVVEESADYVQPGGLGGGPAAK